MEAKSDYEMDLRPTTEVDSPVKQMLFYIKEYFLVVKLKRRYNLKYF